MKENKKFEYICKMNQSTLKSTLTKILNKHYDNVVSDDGFLFAKGSFPVCLLAHMDTVHEKSIETIIYKNGKISSPEGIGGDDRCGIYMILQIIKKYDCSVLFLEDEEIGCVGAKKFIKSDVAHELECNYMIELDRKGRNDAVFYDCDNPDFEEFITKDGDWNTDCYGIYSDISVIAPAIGCAAVNFSCGYYNQHTVSEYVVLAEMEKNIENVCKLLERTTEEDKFEYIAATRNYYYGMGSYYYPTTYATGTYNVDEGYDDDDFDYDYTGRRYYYISYVEHGEEKYSEYYANSDFEALGMFFVNHTNLCYDDVVAIEFWGEDAYNM